MIAFKISTIRSVISSVISITDLPKVGTIFIGFYDPDVFLKFQVQSDNFKKVFIIFIRFLSSCDMPNKTNGSLMIHLIDVTQSSVTFGIKHVGLILPRKRFEFSDSYNEADSRDGAPCSCWRIQKR